MYLFPDGIKHPDSASESLKRYCGEKKMPLEIVRNYEEKILQKGDVYIVFRQKDVVSIIKDSRKLGLECGIDFGLIAYNDTPAYEVIDKGITVLSIDWEKMGQQAADFILHNQPIHTYLPTEIRLRGSL